MKKDYVFAPTCKKVVQFKAIGGKLSGIIRRKCLKDDNDFVTFACQEGAGYVIGGKLFGAEYFLYIFRDKFIIRQLNTEQDFTPLLDYLKKVVERHYSLQHEREKNLLKVPKNG